MTTQVDFYVLARAQASDKYNYACRIANKAHEHGLKVYMQTDEAAQSSLLDAMLWTFSQSSFVPHAIYPGPGQEAESDLERYPVQIGHEDAPDGCVDLLISLRQEAPADYARFGRVAELIVDEAADKSAGRRRFRFYREQGVTPRTHHVS